jgi:hypothetical protein
MTDFKGTIGRTLAEFEPHFVEPPHPGEDPPNLIVLLDDTGFAEHIRDVASLQPTEGDR